MEVLAKPDGDEVQPAEEKELTEETLGVFAHLMSPEFPLAPPKVEEYLAEHSSRGGVVALGVAQRRAEQHREENAPRAGGWASDHLRRERNRMLGFGVGTGFEPGSG